MICKKEIMPVGSDEYACEFRNFDFHERRAAPEDAWQQERERCKKDNEKPDSAQISRDSMTFHRVIDELTDRLMP
jgi:hypothetical protein